MSDFLVGIKHIPENFEVQVSSLSVTPESGARGIADINIVGENEEERVELKIYISKREYDEKRKVKGYKGRLLDDKGNERHWEELDQDPADNKDNRSERWPYYIMARLSPTDPPIAVG